MESQSPPPPLIKVCGLNNPEAACCAAKAGADLLGFIFVKKSKRYVSLKEAENIIAAVDDWISEQKLPSVKIEIPSKQPPEEIKDASSWFKEQAGDIFSRIRATKGRVAPLKVGVFMNHSATEINSIAEKLNLDLIQLHGNEPHDLPQKLCRATIRVIHVDADSTIESLKKNVKPGFSPLLMLDSKGGGTGKAFDWGLADKFGASFPYLLAGGLDPQNVREALKKSRPLGVDVCGGVEKSKGVKDLSKISNFVRIAKSQE